MNQTEMLKLYLQELKRRKNQSKLERLDAKFKQQAAFVEDQSTFIAACTTRRAGKSSGLAYKFFRAGLKFNNVILPYIALTRNSAENIMWPVLKEIAVKEGIECSFLDSDLSCKLQNGSVIKLFGADMKNFIQRLRGIKTPFAAIDEAQSFRSHIEQLVDDILTPAISDYGDKGQLALTGTPGPVPKGYFFDATNGKFGFSCHKWTVYQNPYMPNIQKFVDDLLARKGWTTSNPTYRREWLGDWVADTDALVYKYNSAINTFSTLKNQDYFYVLGVDLGYDPDPTAFSLCAFSEFDRNMYVIETFCQTKMILSDVADRIRHYLRKYPATKIIVDAADKQAVEEMRQRYSLPLVSAEKHGKAGFIELMNADLRRGLIKIHEHDAQELADEWLNLVWDSESSKRQEDGRYANHLSDATLYAWRDCYNYAWREKPKTVNPHSEEAVDLFFEKEAMKLKINSEDFLNDLF